MVSPLAQLLMSMQDALLLISPAGRVKFANDAANRRHGAGVLADIAASSDMQHHLRLASIGKATLPLSIKVQVRPGQPDEQTFGCTLIQAPNQTDFGLLIHQTQSGSAHAEALSSMLEILDQELGAPMRDFLATAGELSGDGPHGLLLHEIVNRLDKLKGVVEVFGSTPLIASERIVLKELVGEAWQSLGPLTRSMRADASLVGFHDDLPPVYGSTDWLRRALRECMDNAVRHSISADSTGGGCHIEIRASLIGEFATLTLRNLGVGAVPRLGDRIYLAFNRAGAPRQHAGHGMTVGIPLSRRIIELHGGHLRISADDEAVVTSIELPTGAPRRDQAEQNLLQAQKYAQDLAKLMARQRRGARPAAAPETPAPLNA